jgi:hypothetical protein
MRTLVQPPPSTHCDRCGGELIFKQLTESASSDFDLVEELLVCVNCSLEQAYTVSHDPYMPHLRVRKAKDAARVVERRAAQRRTAERRAAQRRAAQRREAQRRKENR